MKVAVCIRDFPTGAGCFMKAGEEWNMEPKLVSVAHGKTEVFPFEHPHFFRIEERDWKPSIGQNYFFLDSWLKVQLRTYRCDGDDFALANIGNRFQTFEAAEARIPFVKAALKGDS